MGAGQSAPSKLMRIRISHATTLVLALFVLAGLSLLSTGKAAVTAAYPQLPGVSAQKPQLLALRNSLPSRGVLGYIDEGRNTPEERQRYYYTQYELAPLVIEHSSNAALVIGNFSHPVTPSELPSNLLPVHDFGNGIVLFAKLAQPRSK